MHFLPLRIAKGKDLGLCCLSYWHGTLSAFQTTINNEEALYAKPVTVFTADCLVGPWTVNPVQVGLPVANGAGTETVMFRDSLSGQAPRFMKVEVTRSP